LQAVKAEIGDGQIVSMVFADFVELIDESLIVVRAVTPKVAIG